ncbi:MAG TPA: GyrI-like domain-containing protein [Gammaproteobacteria bacterium]|nr:GyrI-like domain-containing protein [Gammaproteobacteria bacterium]
MRHKIIKLNTMTLVGITVRTNNNDEMDPGRAKIGMLVSNYFNEQMANQIQHRLNPGKTFAVYCEFEQQDQGEYTYLIGEEVVAGTTQQVDCFKTMSIESSRYQKFTSKSGPMPDIVIQSWQEIWQMGAADFVGKRQFKADFEVYDHRAANPEKAVIDLYIGIEG